MSTITVPSWQPAEKPPEDKRSRSSVRADINPRVADLQQFEKDVLVASSPYGRLALYQGVTQAKSKVALPAPTAEWDGFPEAGDHQEGLISIIGRVLALQAKSNSSFWSTLFNQASESMTIEVKLAPIIATSIEQAYQAQSEATQAQADQARLEGIANILAFAGACVMAGMQEWKDPSRPLPTDNDKVVTDKTQEGVEDALKNEKESTKTEEGDGIQVEDDVVKDTDEAVDKLADDMDTEINKTQEPLGDSAKRLVSTAGSKVKRGFSYALGLLSKLSGAAQASSMLSQGITGLTVTSHYQTIKSEAEVKEGEKQALSKQTEQYAQYYGQSFSRSEDLRQGSSQNIDYAMNILKSLADSITQTVTSMFRG